MYYELKQIAGAYMRAEAGGITLQPTALVHEAYIKLMRGQMADWQNRQHFFATAARIMRRVLVDHARARQADKRGGTQVCVPLDEAFVFSEERSPELLALDDALAELASIDPRQCQVVEMRFFAGLTEREIAAVLEVSERTVKREWDHAKTWLYGRLSK